VRLLKVSGIETLDCPSLMFLKAYFTSNLLQQHFFVETWKNCLKKQNFLEVVQNANAPCAR